MTDNQNLLVDYWSEEDVPGGLAREITVPEQHFAVVQRKGDAQPLPAPGPYRVRKAWDGLLGRSVPPVWIVPNGPLTFQPTVFGLPTYENEPVQADLLIQARIVNPLRFWQEHAARPVDLSKRRFEMRLGQALRDVFKKHTRHFLPQALQHQPQATEEIQRQIISPLRVILQGWGMELQNVAHLGFEARTDAVELERKSLAIEQQLAELRAEAAIQQMDLEHMLNHARQEHAIDLTEAEEATVEALAEEEGAAAALEQILKEKLARLEASIQAQLDQLVEEPAPAAEQPAAAEAPAAPVHNHTLERLEDWVALLRVAGTALGLFTAASALYFPYILPDSRPLELAVASIGFLLALLAFGASWLVHQELHRHQRRAERQPLLADEQAEREARIRREQRIRLYLEQRLRRVSENCRQSWQRILDQDMDLACDMRKQCSKAYEILAGQIQAADLSSSGFLQQAQAPLADLARLLALSQGVLDDAEAMVDLSQQLYAAVAAGDLDALRRGAGELDQGRLRIENDWSRREQFLLGP